MLLLLWMTKAILIHDALWIKMLFFFAVVPFLSDILPAQTCSPHKYPSIDTTFRKSCVKNFESKFESI